MSILICHHLCRCHILDQPVDSQRRMNQSFANSEPFICDSNFWRIGVGFATHPTNPRALFPGAAWLTSAISFIRSILFLSVRFVLLFTITSNLRLGIESGMTIGTECFPPGFLDIDRMLEFQRLSDDSNFRFSRYSLFNNAVA